MNSDSNTHDHELGSFDNLAIDTEQVSTLQSAETEVREPKVAIVDDGRVEVLRILEINLTI